jgi:hypothetical protein
MPVVAAVVVEVVVLLGGQDQEVLVILMELVLVKYHQLYRVPHKRELGNGFMEQDLTLIIGVVQVVRELMVPVVEVEEHVILFL